MLTARLRDLCKFPQNCVQEPREPDALSLAMLSDAIHAVVPVARAHQRQTVAAHIQAAVERSGAMFEQRSTGLRYSRLEIGLALAFRQQLTFKEGNCFVQQGGVASGLQEMNHGIGK